MEQLFFFVCLLALFGGAILTYKSLKETTREHEVRDIINIHPKTKKEDFFRLGYFQPLKNTNFILIPLNSSKKNDFSFSSHKNSKYTARNYLLFDKKTKESSWVWESNDRLILKEERIIQGKGKSEKVIGVVFESIEKDSRSRPNDMKVVDFFDISNFARTPVLKDVNRVFGIQQTSDAEILIFFLASKKKLCCYL